MSKNTSILLVLGLLCGAASAPADESTNTSALDLDACYERALAHNERVGIASAEWQAAEDRYRQVRDTLLPAISLTGSAQFQNDRRGASTGGTTASRAPESYLAQLHAEQTLYSGFRSTREAEAREAEGRAAELDVKRVRELLYLDVADAYYQALLFERDLAVLATLDKALNETVTELEKRVALGRSPKADLLSAQSNLAELQVDQETSRGLRAASRELLAFLLDVPAAALVLADETPFPSDPDLESKLARAATRSDVLAGAARAEAASRGVGAAQADRKPQVQAQGNLYGYEEPDENHEWNVLLTFSLPLFDEGVIRSKVRERQQQYRISELNLAAVRRQADSEVRSAYIAFMSAAAQRARLRDALNVAEENYDVQKRDYELGRASQLDALSALAQVQRLRRREVAAEMLARTGLVRLHVAAGEVGP